ncbi:MAG: RAMP superfamily CRISPR-associated protein [Acidobacteria bacterium]|nr:RAMP superfamily CRISPR-associated protein [Acidobacteriota bacterium]
MQPIRFTVKVEFEGDWHVGLGAGRHGQADRLVVRDGGGLPYVPAKTLTGIWRDACERVALGLDDNKPGHWCQWVEAIFGSQPQLSEGLVPERFPRPALLSVRSAHYPDKLRDLLSRPGMVALREAMTFLKPGVRIDSDTGQAEEDHLRFEEVTRGGCVLEADAELHNDIASRTDAVEKISALLWAGAKIVERLGGKRRRGLGRCKLFFSPMPSDADALSVLDCDPGPPPCIATKSNTATFDISNPTAVSEWVDFDIHLKTISPVVVAEGTLGNVVVSRDCIPGTYLLGPVTRALNGSDLDLFPYVAAGEFQVLFAYREVAGARGRSVPFCLFYRKEAGGLDKAESVRNRLKEKVEDATQLKNHREGYLGPEDKDRNGTKRLPRLEKQPLDVHTHNVIDDEPQRPTEAVGGIYSYEAIPAHTRLRSVLRLRRHIADRLGEKWWEKLLGEHRLGRSKKDDFGRVCIVEVTKRESDAFGGGSVGARTGDVFTLWLLSDLLIRDERLRPTTRPEDLARLLEQELSPKEQKLDLKVREQKDLLSVPSRGHRTESWHQGWGLPRPSFVGFAAGTCFVFDVTKGSVDASAFGWLEQAGLGERRAEGYGQVVFNALLVSEALEKWEAPPMGDPDNAAGASNGKSSSKDLLPKNDGSFDYARLIEYEAWRREIQRAALALGTDKQTRRTAFGWIDNKPSNSQLGAFRSVLGRLRGNDPSQKQNIIGWLNDLDKEKWDTNAVQRLKVLVHEQKVWEWLELRTLPALTENAESEIKPALWAETVRAVVNACIKGEIRDREHRM